MKKMMTMKKKKKKKKKKKGNALFNGRTQSILFTVIWRQTYRKRPPR